MIAQVISSAVARQAVQALADLVKSQLPAGTITDEFFERDWLPLWRELAATLGL
jgi:hypothetical protein